MLYCSKFECKYYIEAAVTARNEVLVLTNWFIINQRVNGNQRIYIIGFEQIDIAENYDYKEILPLIIS